MFPDDEKKPQNVTVKTIQVNARKKAEDLRTRLKRDLEREATKFENRTNDKLKLIPDPDETKTDY